MKTLMVMLVLGLKANLLGAIMYGHIWQDLGRYEKPSDWIGDSVLSNYKIRKAVDSTGYPSYQLFKDDPHNSAFEYLIASNSDKAVLEAAIKYLEAPEAP